MRVLIVEDDVPLGLFLQKGLKLEGHDVVWAGDGDAALEQCAALQPDLMVLDLSLPRRDGVEVLRSLQEAEYGTPQGMAVLVLTGRGETEERVRCLDLGADDCLLKPFSFHELSARCRALLRRRSQKSQDAVLRHGAVSLDRMTRAVTHEGRPVELTAKEFSLLEYLLLRRGECCSRSELLTEVWQMSPSAATNVVDVYINYLRRKLTSLDGAEAGNSVIQTVRGSGYRMTPAGDAVHHFSRKGPLGAIAALPSHMKAGA